MPGPGGDSPDAAGCSCTRGARLGRQPNTRQKSIHIHQYISTVSDSKQVYCILDNWCIWINLSCGLGGFSGCT